MTPVTIALRATPTVDLMTAARALGLPAWTGGR
jgi:hypothetical protein